jgi:hypothetical protein
MVTRSAKGPTQQSLGDWAKDQSMVANISELARASGKDRATVVKRLQAAGVLPVHSRKKEKQYDIALATAALSREPLDQSGYHKARTQKTTAEAALILLKLQRERGDLAPVAELREHAYQFIKAMQQRFTRYTREARVRLHRAKTPNELGRQLDADFALIFDNVKRDYPNIF